MTFLERVRELARLNGKRTRGEWEYYDNEVSSNQCDGEKGHLIAECFGANPMHGDNSNDTEFIAANANLCDEMIRVVELLHRIKGHLEYVNQDRVITTGERRLYDEIRQLFDGEKGEV